MNIEQRLTLVTDAISVTLSDIDKYFDQIHEGLNKIEERLDKLEARQDLSRYAPSRSFLGGNLGDLTP